MTKYKTIHKEIEINQETLNTYGEYLDKIYLDDEGIIIRLIVKKAKPQFAEKTYKIIGETK